MLIPIGPSIRFENGIDSQTQLPKAAALDFDNISLGNGGQQVIATLDLITSQEKLLEKLNFSASASIKIGLGSGDVRMKFAQESAYNEYSVYLLATVIVSNPPKTLVNRRLKPEALALAKRDIHKFRNTYGDYFIDEVFSGGEFRGLYIFTAHDKTTKEHIEASFSASYGPPFAHGELNANFGKDYERALSKSTLQVRAMILGGKDIENPSNKDGLIAVYEAFNKQVGAHPIDHQASIQKWEYFPLPEGESIAVSQVRDDCIEQCSQRITRAITQRSKIQYIQSNPIQFENPDLEDLSAKLTAIEDRIPKWAKVAEACSSSIDECKLAGLDNVNVSFPERIATLDPLQAKWEYIMKHDVYQYEHWFKEDFHPKKRAHDYEYNEFQGGRYWIFESTPGHPVAGIFWHPSIDGGNAHSVVGGIFTTYNQRGHCQGPLGFPKSDVVPFNKNTTMNGWVTEWNYKFTGKEYIAWFENGQLWWDGVKTLDVLPIKLFIPRLLMFQDVKRILTPNDK
jgi:hypothetical protein